MNRFCPNRSALSVWRLCGCMAVACSILAIPPMALAQLDPTDAQLGRWEEPPPVDQNYCWTDGAMHSIHLPPDLSSTTGKILIWRNPGCGAQPNDGLGCPPPNPPEPPRTWNPRTGAFVNLPLAAPPVYCTCTGQQDQSLTD